MSNLQHDIKTLIEAVDKDFSPPLSTLLNIQQYAQKLEQLAVLFFVYENAKPIAMIANYCNDEKKLQAFMSLLAVDPKHRSKGLASNLVRTSLDYIQRLGFKTYALEVYKNNEAAIQLYTKLGFLQVEERAHSFIFEYTFSKPA